MYPLRWTGNIEAQQLADAAYSSLKSRKKPRRRIKRKPKHNRFKSYAEFLQSKSWASKRKHALAYHGHVCQTCGATDTLHVHHKHYRKPLGHESMKDLQVLCAACHELEHEEKLFDAERKAINMYSEAHTVETQAGYTA